ncbi:hypothetical protein QTN47_04490 [Danxiaibacter flavus]|uniref:Uncharacterized protein n=1 Tax=Danxiaibacter flavus TaxID=3049108 RepID=A0ABV3ZA56_9BACT|nr:hypothetical protein QNM32_04490 [Chitinophagaceae bacterium DXS]
MRKIHFLAGCLFCMVLASRLHAQTNDEKASAFNPVDFTMQLKNMHLWRGYVVSNTALADVDLGVKTKNGEWKAGVWGAAGFTGVYKEFDYYLSYTKKGFTAAFWDIYNFSENATWNNKEVFNYKDGQCGHILDLSVTYQLQGKFPLKASWATLLYGRDKDSKNDKNRYSTYVELGYPVLKSKKVNLDFGIGGAFALKPETGCDANFYSSKPNIVNINFTASKTVVLGTYALPVSAMVMWNPELNHANIQLALNIF